MEITITSKQEKPLLSRTEIIADIMFDAATPKKEEIRQKISASLKSDLNLTVVKKVETVFGQKKAGVLVFVYKNEKDMKNIEPKQKGKKKGAKQESPKEEPKSELEESKKEEKKESPKEEKSEEDKK